MRPECLHQLDSSASEVMTYLLERSMQRVAKACHLGRWAEQWQVIEVLLEEAYNGERQLYSRSISQIALLPIYLALNRDTFRREVDLQQR